MIFVATARWCEEHWVVAAGHDKESVIRDAELAILKPTLGGYVAEDYIIEEIAESEPWTQTSTPK